MAAAKLSENRLISLVMDHRNDCVQSEQRWKEAFYRWEAQYYMKYLAEQLATRKSDSQSKNTFRSSQYIGYAHAQIETAVAKSLVGLWAKFPPFEVDPEGGMSFEDANVVKALHAHSFRMDKMYPKSRRALRFLYIYGTVPWKHLWCEKYIREGTMMPTMVEGPEGPVYDYTTVASNKLVYEGPESLVVDPYNFHIDPLAESVDTARFILEDFIRSGDQIEELMAQGLYNKIKLSEVGTHVAAPHEQNYRQRRQDVIGSNEAQQSSAESDDLSSGLYDVTEHWTDDRIVTIIGTFGGAQKVLRDRPNPFLHGKKPYTLWQYIDLAGETWGLPMSRQLEGPQSELNMIRRMRSDALLQSLRRMWRASPAARSRIREADLVYRPEGIVYANKDEIEALDSPQLNLFSYKEEDVLRADGDFITGITDVVRGSAAPSTTATVGQLNANFATDRLSMSLDNIADGFDEMLTIRHQLFRQFVSQDQVVHVAGREGLKLQTAGVEVIRNNYGFRFICGRGMGQREVQRTHLLNLLTIAAQNPQVGLRIDFDKLITDVCATFDALPDPTRYLLTQSWQSIPQETELMVMMTGVPMPVNLNDNHVEHLQVIAQFTDSPQYESVPPEIKQIIEEHGKQHIPLAQNQLAAMQATGASGSPKRPMIPGAATNDADVMKTINRQNAPQVAPNA